MARVVIPPEGLTPAEVAEAMQDPANCRQCHGVGKVADDAEGTSWLEWANLPKGSDIAVRMKLVVPVECPTCGGDGESGNRRF